MTELTGRLSRKQFGKLTRKQFGKLTKKQFGKLPRKQFGKLPRKLPRNLFGKLSGKQFGKLPRNLFGKLSGKQFGKLPRNLFGKLSGKQFGKLPGNLFGKQDEQHLEEKEATGVVEADGFEVQHAPENSPEKPPGKKNTKAVSAGKKNTEVVSATLLAVICVVALISANSSTSSNLMTTSGPVGEATPADSGNPANASSNGIPRSDQGQGAQPVGLSRPTSGQAAGQAVPVETSAVNPISGPLKPSLPGAATPTGTEPGERTAETTLSLDLYGPMPPGIPWPSSLVAALWPDSTSDPSETTDNEKVAASACAWGSGVQLESPRRSDPLGLADSLINNECKPVQLPPFTGESLGRPARIIRYGPSGSSTAPRLYLTFDDGPDPYWTLRVLDLLDRHGARATFFPTGVAAASYPALIGEIVNSGHTLGSHLWSHTQTPMFNEHLFRKELRDSAALLSGHITNCLRPPYGILNDEIRRWSGEEGFELLMWGDPDTLDWTRPSTNVLIDRILNNIKPGTILLFHEHSGAETLAAIDFVLETLIADGWQVDTPICPLSF